MRTHFSRARASLSFCLCMQISALNMNAAMAMYLIKASKKYKKRGEAASHRTTDDGAYSHQGSGNQGAYTHQGSGN